LGLGSLIEFIASILKIYRLRQGLDQIDIERLLKRLKLAFSTKVLKWFKKENEK